MKVSGKKERMSPTTSWQGNSSYTSLIEGFTSSEEEIGGPIPLLKVPSRKRGIVWLY